MNDINRLDGHCRAHTHTQQQQQQQQDSEWSKIQKRIQSDTSDTPDGCGVTEERLRSVRKEKALGGAAYTLGWKVGGVNGIQGRSILAGRYHFQRCRRRAIPLQSAASHNGARPYTLYIHAIHTLHTPYTHTHTVQWCWFLLVILDNQNFSHIFFSFCPNVLSLCVLYQWIFYIGVFR